MTKPSCCNGKPLAFFTGKYLLVGLLLWWMMLQTIVAQGPIDGFMKQKGETDIALTYSFETYDQYWFGDQLEDRELDVRSFSFFMAHALNRRTNLILSIPYLRSQTESNFQDAIVAFKFYNDQKKYSHGKLSKITAIGFSFPISDYQTDVENPIGEKAVSFLLRHLYQYQSNQGWFVHLQSGMEFRVLPIAKLGIPVVVRAGWGTRKWYFDGWFDFFHTFNGGVNQTIAAGEGSQFSRIGGTIYYAIIDQVGVFISGNTTLNGKNIGDANRVNTGIVLRRF